MNACLPQVPPPTVADWHLLSDLFAGESGAFRHHMSLTRTDARHFYDPTPLAALIRAQKMAILESPEADQYVLDCVEGSSACHEFFRFLAPVPSFCHGQPDEPMQIKTATLALEPDWLLLTPPDWKLVCASVCFPTRWSLAGKALQPLASIHAVVPDLQQELGRKIDVFFRRMATGDGWGRANWGLSSSAEWNQHPTLPYVPLSKETPITGVSVRLESQNLLKLPETGAIAFGIRILNFPLVEVAARSPIATGLKQQLRTMPREIAAYKGIPENVWERF